MPSNKIIHGLQVMSSALSNAPPPTSISQVEAIANLRDLFESWHLIGPPSSGQGRILPPGRPRVSIQEPPRVASPSSPMVVPPPQTTWMPPLAWSRQLRYPSLSTVPFRLRHVTSHSMMPHLQGWPLHPVLQERSSNPDLHALSRTCLLSLTEPGLTPKLPLPSLQAAAPAATASPTTFLRLKPYVFLKNLWALRAFVKRSPCPPRKLTALHTSVQR
jgi:hypothetical protein